MPVTEILGFSAAFCTTISFLPQVIKVLKTRDTSSLSLGMYIVFNIGVCLWLAYGIARSDLVIIIANVITLILAMSILCTKLYNDVVKSC